MLCVAPRICLASVPLDEPSSDPRIGLDFFPPFMKLMYSIGLKSPCSSSPFSDSSFGLSSDGSEPSVVHSDRVGDRLYMDFSKDNT